MIFSTMFAAVALASAPAADASLPARPTAREEARIAFPGHTVRNFRADGRSIVYLEGPRRQWYRATLMTPCFDLPWTQAIGIDTRGSAELDRFGAIVVGQERCQIQSLVSVDGPPPKLKAE